MLPVLPELSKPTPVQIGQKLREKRILKTRKPRKEYVLPITPAPPEWPQRRGGRPRRIQKCGQFQVTEVPP